MRIAVDVGFGFTKACNDGNLTCIFPSIIQRRKKPNSALSELMGGSSEEYNISVSFNEEEAKDYYVGDSALTNGGVRKWADKKDFNEEELKVLISTAIGKINPTGQDVDLIVGLPMSYYTTKKDDILKILKGVTFNSHIEGIGKNKVYINSVYCYPQGWGSYWSEILDKKGNVKNIELARMPIGVIDIGYRTIDYLIMEQGRKGTILAEEFSGSLEEDGMYKVFSSTEKKVSDEYGREVGMDTIEKGLLWFGRKIYFEGKERDISPFFEEALKENSEQIATKIKQIWGSKINNLAFIFLSGGGGNEFYPYLNEKFKQLKIQENSSFSNCKGFLGIQAMLLKKS